MSVVPSRHLVRVRRMVAGAPDEFGNATSSWVERDWLVRAIAPGGMVEPGQPNRDLSMVAWTLYADVTPLVPTECDEVRLPSSALWHKVSGVPSPWDIGPWANPAAGVVVELVRADG